MTGSGPSPSEAVVAVEVGRRVLVAGNLALGPEPTAATRAAAEGLARTLDGWEGPGLVVLAGNVLDLGGPAADDDEVARRAADALGAHGPLQRALGAFAAADGRRVLWIPGAADRPVADRPPVRAVAEGLGAEVAGAVELELATAAGPRRVRVTAGAAPATAGPAGTVTPQAGAPWQAGLDRLADPAALHRFLTSRLLYRRFARLAWWLLVPFVAVAVLRLSWVTNWLSDLLRSHPLPASAIARARGAGWPDRLAAAGLVAVAFVVVLAVVLAVVSRQAWAALGGGTIAPPGGALDGGATVNDAGRDTARHLIAAGYAGVVSGATLQAELTHLGDGFFACTGAAGEVVEEHPGRLGLPPVFLHHQQLAWVELETGADLHARLLLARVDATPATVLERLAARYRLTHDPHPVVVAALPNGGSWPPGPDLGAVRRRSRRFRRWGSAAIFVAGLVDLLSAVTPPLRGRLHLLLEVLPLGASQLAGALVALAGVGLLALARGVRRGQRRAWAVACAVLAVTIVAHLVRGIDVVESVLSAVVLVFLLATRDEFQAESDRPSLRSAARGLVVGAATVTVLGSVVLAVVLHTEHRHRMVLRWWQVVLAVVERLAGVQDVALPRRVNEFLSPALLAVGVCLAVAAVVLATRPVVDRRLGTGRLAQVRARDVVGRHGQGTLDYFALRSDKRWFFHRDSLVAYAIVGGVCLVSPDPIGPRSEREAVWVSFRRFADAHGWVVAVMGASEEWLPLYRATGMHDIYIGDEAVVDVSRFSLEGGHMKGLRQAHNRIAKYGYTASFHDPARLDPATAGQLAGLMAQSRRGEFERGFSMMLGRIFDPRDHGLLLCVVRAPDGSPAAMCQFVPARGIGGYSLDLMRRDRGEHPNGLLDFALVSTIEHLRAEGCRGLSLNFAAMRSVLEGERGDGVTQRVERWALKKMSSFLQIETLWRFNAKYRPDWLSRYIVYDTAEHLVPAVLAIMKVESLWEVPVIGRVIAAADRKAHAEAQGRAAESGASLLPGGGADRSDEAGHRDAAQG